eukprot:jgi/Galph1/2724/GphlegSOOS_G1423.1
MARLGQGDKRWIVQDREDGTNVNHWHWDEHDVTSWSCSRLKELLTSRTRSVGENLLFQVTSVDDVKGEATVYVRKGRIKGVYDLEVQGRWSIQTEKSEQNETVARGTLYIELLSGEPDIRFQCEESSAALKTIDGNWEGKARQLVEERVEKFVEELAAGANLSMNKLKKMGFDPNAASETNAEFSIERDQEGLRPYTEAAGKVDKSTGVSVKKLDLRDVFRASPKDLFDCFVIAAKIQAYTRQSAQITPRVNEPFSLLNGQISGKILEIQPEKRLVQEWRMKDWPVNHYSRVTLIFEAKESEGLTNLHLIQESVPEEFAEQTEQGWKQHIFLPIKVIFGYAAEIPF